MITKNIKKTIAITSAIALIAATAASTVAAATAKDTKVSTTTSSVSYTGKTPKYIFMFIGDGMSYPQIQATAD